MHNRLAFAIFCWHFLNQKDVQDMYYRWTPMLLSNLSQPLDEVRLSFHISQLILVSINCATCNMVINLIFFLTSKCFVFQPLWLIYAPFVFRSWLKKKRKKRKKSTYHHYHHIYASSILSHLYLIYVYVWVICSRFTCLRHWIRSWYTQHELCDIFNCYHKSHLRYEITSFDFNNMDMFSILRYGLELY